MGLLASKVVPKRKKIYVRMRKKFFFFGVLTDSADSYSTDSNSKSRKHRPG
jgi:hypothetical protein